MDIFADDTTRLLSGDTNSDGATSGNFLVYAPESEPAQSRCGCEIHFSIDGLSIIVDMPVSSLSGGQPCRQPHLLNYVRKH